MQKDNPQWYRQAACITKPSSYFFPEHEPNDKRIEHYLYGRAVCTHCPVRSECLDYAMTREKDERWRFGLWGGMTPTERWIYDPQWRLGSKNK